MTAAPGRCDLINQIQSTEAWPVRSINQSKMLVVPTLPAHTHALLRTSTKNEVKYGPQPTTALLDCPVRTTLNGPTTSGSRHQTSGLAQRSIHAWFWDGIGGVCRPSCRHRWENALGGKSKRGNFRLVGKPLKGRPAASRWLARGPPPGCLALTFLPRSTPFRLNRIDHMSQCRASVSRGRRCAQRSDH